MARTPNLTWGAHEDALLRSGLPARKIADKLGISETSVRRRASKLGIDMNILCKKWPQWQLDILRDPTLSLDDMVERTGRTKTSVKNTLGRLRRNGEASYRLQKFCQGCGADISDRANTVKWCGSYSCRSIQRSEGRMRRASDPQRRVDNHKHYRRTAALKDALPKMEGYRPWTDAEIESLSGLTVRAAAVKLNRSYLSILGKKYGPKRPRKRIMAPRWEDWELDLIYSGLSNKEVAEQTGRSIQAARKARQGLRKIYGDDISHGHSPNRRPWTSAEDKLLREKYLTHSARSLAVSLCRSQSAVQQRARVLGLPPKDRPWEPWELDIIQDPGLSTGEKIELTGRTKAAIWGMRAILKKRQQKQSGRGYGNDLG